MDTDALQVQPGRAVNGRLGRWSWKKFWLSLAIALLVAMLAMFAFMVYDDHYVQRGRFFLGTRIAGINVSHKSRVWASAQVKQRIAAPLLAPLAVTYGSRKWTLNTQSVAEVDVKGMVAEAYGAGWNQGILQRLYKRWLREPLNVDVPVRFTYDRAQVQGFVTRVQRQINRKPIDARQYVAGYKIKISPSRIGYRLNRKDAITRTEAALPAGQRQLKLRVAVLQPKVTKKDFKHALFLNMSQNTIYLYTYDKITKSYRVATGQPGFRTPTGDWKIINKRYNPTWTNPHEPWSAGMPESIGPGPGNPLGTRALDLNAPAIRIHGTYSDGSIGSYASHGCIRMHIWESEDLFERVEVGTPVYIRW